MTAIDQLPGEGLRCIEASAGTGKTHRLSTLAARWLVERDDVPPAALLVVTYTIAAARELRARIRSRLVEVHRLLLDATPPIPDDLAWCTDPPNRTAWIARTERALAAFDEISISTIHAFAAGALGGSLRMVDTGDLRRRHVVANVLATAAFDPNDTLLSSPRVASSTLENAVARALDNPDVLLAPFDRADASGAARAHVDAVKRAVSRFAELGHRDGVRTYADLITELYAGVMDDSSPMLATLRARYSVGLIDEFQDTDPLQWEIFRRLFLDVPGKTLVVVADPKQAIYGFRGADVDTYLAARSLAAAAVPGDARIESLSRNYRSDRSLLRALNTLFAGATFDDDGEIEYVAVEPQPGAVDQALGAVTGSVAPLSIRVSTWGMFAAERQRAIAEDCAQAAAEALTTTIDTPSGSRPVTEADVVVLCRARTQFPLLRAAFLRHGIRTTEAKTDDVLRSVAALDVAIALRAMSEPTNVGAVLAVAHSWLGCEVDDPDPVSTARRRIVEWSDVLERRGVASLARLLTDPVATPGLLATPGGERLVTDLHHVFEVLAETAPHGAGAVQLLDTLDELRRIEKAPDDELRTRRIDTDEPAVRLMTVHGAKGLEFPVVLCPFLQNFRGDEVRLSTMWRDRALRSRVLDASDGSKWTDDSLTGATREDRSRCVESAEAGELRRLLYVALTRAEHRTVVWWEGRGRRQSQQLDELTWLLLDRDEDGRVVRRSRPDRSEDVAVYDLGGASALAQLRAQFTSLLEAGDLELTEVVAPRTFDAAVERPARSRVDEATGMALGVAVLDRALVQRAPRCSFSSLVADSHDAMSLDESVGDSRADDEPAPSDLVDVDVDDTATPGSAPDPFGGARGTSFGSAVHEALESAFTRGSEVTFDAALADGLRSASRRHDVDVPPEAIAGLVAATSARIGEGPALRDLALDDVAAEIGFNLPVADGVSVADLANCLLAAGGAGPFADWAERLAADRDRRALAAGLVGSIDLVSSFGTNERYSVVDYKTNVSWPSGYGTEALRAAMSASDYPLQALLYLVALHRLLRWRLPDYDPSRHLGGAHYLFLRGMRPGSNEGIVSWSPGPAAIRAVSDLLAGAA